MVFMVLLCIDAVLAVSWFIILIHGYGIADYWRASFDTSIFGGLYQASSIGDILTLAVARFMGACPLNLPEHTHVYPTPFNPFYQHAQSRRRHRSSDALTAAASHLAHPHPTLLLLRCMPADATLLFPACSTLHNTGILPCYYHDGGRWMLVVPFLRHIILGALTICWLWIPFKASLFFDVDTFRGDTVDDASWLAITVGCATVPLLLCRHCAAVMALPCHCTHHT